MRRSRGSTRGQGSGRRFRWNHGRGRTGQLSDGGVLTSGRGGPPARRWRVRPRHKCLRTWHLEDPDAGLREACRILRSRGRFAFTTWLSPDQGFDLFAIVVAAIRQHGTLELPLPPVPPPFRFADPVEASRSLAAAGFEAVTHERHACLWRTRRGADLLELIYKSLVRAPMLIEHQRVEARMLIQSEIVTRAEAFRSGDGYIELQFPYLLLAATKL